MSITVIRRRLGAATTPDPTVERMRLVSESGAVSVTVPFAPTEIEYGGLAPDWATADRPGAEPLLLRTQQPLATLGFSYLLTDPVERDWPQTAAFNALVTLARQRERVLVRYGPSEAGLWRITDAGVSSLMRHPVTNEITRATVSIKLTLASDPAPAVGPVSRPAPPPAPAPAPARSHTVVRGDTLWGIAQRYYGSGPLWPRIYDANRTKIKDPHWIYPGQTFVIP
jgi:nucleoid-associated protein YgaU